MAILDFGLGPFGIPSEQEHAFVAPTTAHPNNRSRKWNPLAGDFTAILFLLNSSSGPHEEREGGRTISGAADYRFFDGRWPEVVFVPESWAASVCRGITKSQKFTSMLLFVGIEALSLAFSPVVTTG
jgi:hypothetical protein